MAPPAGVNGKRPAPPIVSWLRRLRSRKHHLERPGSERSGRREPRQRGVGLICTETCTETSCPSAVIVVSATRMVADGLVGRVFQPVRRSNPGRVGKPVPPPGPTGFPTRPAKQPGTGWKTRPTSWPTRRSLPCCQGSVLRVGSALSIRWFSNRSSGADGKFSSHFPGARNGAGEQVTRLRCPNWLESKRLWRPVLLLTGLRGERVGWHGSDATVRSLPLFSPIGGGADRQGAVGQASSLVPAGGDRRMGRAVGRMGHPSCPRPGRMAPSVLPTGPCDDHRLPLLPASEPGRTSPSSSSRGRSFLEWLRAVLGAAEPEDA
jgi:hypothetical protein